ncbi:MAG TPA: ATP-binding protein, partial [Gemmataceae bacterium]|nr:ATP-binding protein [Gemmataceae bacterium]
TLVRGEDGSPKSRLVVNTDVTEKRRLEANLLRAQRTESLGTLAGGIAHDINNILTPIVMGIDLLKSGLPGSPFQPLLADMETSAQRGTEMVRQILSFARGGGEGQKMNLRLKQVLSDIEKMVRRTFPKTITTRTRVEPELSPVWGDATQLYQTLMNLCVNARDAMPEGGMLTVEAANVQVDADTARIHPDAQPGPYVLLSVTDTGTGIPPQVLERIFDPFFTTKEQGKGTGLGLATVLGIVKGHGGFLNVTSEVGVGTCFSVYLPAVPVAQAEKTESEAVPWPTGQGETILVVDDEPRICQLTKQTLESHGYHVLTAANGAEALALYARHQDNIGAVLTDLMMPVMDGAATIQALRNLDPGVRVIATSGLTPARKPTEMFPDNVYAFLAKPFTMADLMTTLHTVLREPARTAAEPALA